nr:hypothetical protein GCM10025699_23290 [Microbacterium flavescens]
MTDPTPPSARARAPRVHGTVRVVGAGLLGASIGHALSALGVDVALDDTSPAQLRLAVDYGAGRRAAADDDPTLIVVAVPPDVTADVIERELTRFPRAVVTDVASVKLEPLHILRDRGVDLTHYIGSHPWRAESAAERSPPAPTSSSDARGWCAATARRPRAISPSSRRSPSISVRCRSR